MGTKSGNGNEKRERKQPVEKCRVKVITLCTGCLYTKMLFSRSTARPFRSAFCKTIERAVNINLNTLIEQSKSFQITNLK